MRIFFAIIIFILALPLWFLVPIGTIIGGLMMLFSWWLVNSTEDSGTKKLEKSLKEKEQFEKSRMENPLDNNVIKNSKKFYANNEKFESHNDWLNYHIDLLEEHYSKSSNIFTNREGSIVPFSFELSKLIKTPNIYKDICSFCKREPIPELVEDWQIIINRNKNEEIENLLRIQKEFDIIENHIRTFDKEGFNRQEIVKKVYAKSSENFDLMFIRQYDIRRINDEWIISHNDEKRTQTFKL